mmetsp:Transcript_32287/g.59199  ORF Transcript_32287/g.59199 Transcript_32287/m.59199 type:complete len:236 (+) Transcript_32287:162-869(+)
MPSSVRVLRTEDWTNLEDAFESTTRRGHLFVQLRTHTQTRRLAKVIKGEDIGPALTRPRQQLGSVNLNKVFREQVLPKQGAYHRLHAEDGLISRRTQIDPTIIKPPFLSNPPHFRVGISVVIVRPHVGLLHEVGTAGVLHLKGHGGRGLVDAVVTRHLNFHVGLCCSIDGIFGHRQCSANVDDGFHRHARHVFDHGRGDSSRLSVACGFERYALNGVQRRTEEYERPLSYTPRRV